MGDQKITAPLPPIDWDLPDFPDDSVHPVKSFNDDHVGAKNKLEESARQRANDDRGVVEHGRDVLQKHTKIEEAGAFRSAQEDEVARRQRLMDQAQTDKPQQPGDNLESKDKAKAKHARRGPREAPGQESEHLSKVEQRLWSVMDGLHALGDELEHLQAPTPEAEAQTKMPVQGRLEFVETRAAKMELQLRHQLQLLLAGGVGLTLLADPRLTFKRLFDRIRRWPKRVRPGHRPESDEDFDAFLSWVFEPPATPDDAQEELSAW